MAAKAKLKIIEALDWIDYRLIGHRWHSLCCFLCDNSWWGYRQGEVKQTNQNVLDNYIDKED